MRDPADLDAQAEDSARQMEVLLSSVETQALLILLLTDFLSIIQEMWFPLILEESLVFWFITIIPITAPVLPALW